MDTKKVMDTIIFGGVQMGKKRRQYTKEFKIEAVRLIVEEGRRISEVARELGISEALLGRWKKKYQEGK
ncbi:MAG: transposase, partial [Nitrospinae bacterium]|nr:transposase [Nitrospinota bacterium]